MCPGLRDQHVRAVRCGARALCVALLLGVIGVGAPARAQPEVPTDGAKQRDDVDSEPGAGALPDDGPHPWVEGVPHATRLRAHRSFKDGNILIKEGLFARAAVRYREAIERWDHPIFHYNLAIAEINLDQPIRAYQSFQRALRYGGRALGPDRSEQARSFLTLLDNQLAHVEVVCDEPGAAVTLDGKPLFTGPGRHMLMALPGGHQLMADKIGRLPDTRQLVLAPGQRARFSLAPRLPAYLVTERRWPAWKPWAVTAAALAVVTGGAVLDWRADVLFDRHDGEAGRLCLGQAGCAAEDIPAGLHRQLERAQRLQRGAHAVYAVGGVALAGGAILLYLNRERPVRRGGGIESARVSVFPVLAPHVTGLSASVDF